MRIGPDIPNPRLHAVLNSIAIAAWLALTVFALAILLSGCGTGPGGYAWGNAARGLSYGLQAPYRGGYYPQPVYQSPQPTAPRFTPMQMTHSTTCSSTTNSTGYTQTVCY